MSLTEAMCRHNMFIAVPMKMLYLHRCKCGVFTQKVVYEKTLSLVMSPNQSIALLSGKETRRMSRRSITWLADSKYQRLGEHQRHTMWQTSLVSFRWFTSSRFPHSFQ